MPDTFGNPENEPVELGAKVKEVKKLDPEKIRKAIDANPKAYQEIAMNNKGYLEKLCDIEDQIEEDIKKSGIQKEYTETRVVFMPLRMELKIEGVIKIYHMPLRMQISPYKVGVKINRNKVKVVEEPEEKKRIKIE